jgi:hypothetical protein
MSSAPRQFSWSYQDDPIGQQGRTWTQIGASDWIELYEAGQHTYFAVQEEVMDVEGNSGQTVESEGRDILVFIPDVNADGTDPDLLRFMHPGDTQWSNLGQFIPGQTPRQFSWNYQADPLGQQGRTWTQIGAANWVELYEAGQRTFFTVIDAVATVDGNSGQVVESDGKDIIVFIPDAFAQGTDPNWLRFMHPGDSQWGYLGQFT